MASNRFRRFCSHAKACAKASCIASHAAQWWSAGASRAAWSSAIQASKSTGLRQALRTLKTEGRGGICSNETENLSVNSTGQTQMDKVYPTHQTTSWMQKPTCLSQIFRGHKGSTTATIPTSICSKIAKHLCHCPATASTCIAVVKLVVSAHLSLSWENGVSTSTQKKALVISDILHWRTFNICQVWCYVAPR